MAENTLQTMIEVLPLIKNKLATDKEIKEYLNLGRASIEDVSDQIVYDAPLDTSELNEINNSQTFISLNIYSIENLETSYAGVIRVGVAANTQLPPIKGVPVPLLMMRRVVEVVSGSKYNLPNKPAFHSADEVHFDAERTIQGYMLVFYFAHGDQVENQF